ncbi:MAG: hypothetical protein KF729_27055 [Sandaracinaceae bacterium]|nr:hypothetical protein [Sandaracinaceae bacterium]
MNVVRTALFGVSLLAAGCWGNEVTSFPEGLEPLGENDLPGPGTAADPYPEEYQLVGTSGGRFDRILGRGYIHAPIAQVWAAYRNPAVGADRRTSPEWTSEPVEDHPYDDSYVVYHVAHEIVTVEWWVTWRHGLVSGTQESPELVSIRWQKTNGSTLISVIEGSLLLRPVTPTITEVELVYHASAAGAGTDTYVRYMNDVFNDAVAVVHDRPLPTFD